jgi:rhomboid family GlyGly-CTERM serine protease
MRSLRPALWLYALPAIALALLPATHAALLYDRAAIAQGQLWRLWTGHWVHFSWSHLGWNLLVLLVAGSWLEKLRPRLLRRYTLLAPPLISGALLFFAPAMARYGGLSGLATGVVTLLACARILNGQRWEGACWLTLLAAKLAYDFRHQTPLLVQFDSVVSSHHSHILGAFSALAFFAAALLLAKDADQSQPAR